MNDLESTRARSPSAAPISAAAIGKLRAVGGHLPAFAQTEGLVDAFAEVFARMAVTQTVEPYAPPQQPGPRQKPDEQVRGEQEAAAQDSDQTEARPQDDGEVTEPSLLDAAPIIVAAQFESQAERETDMELGLDDGNESQQLIEVEVVDVSERQLQTETDLATLQSTAAAVDLGDREQHKRNRQEAAVVPVAEGDQKGVKSRLQAVDSNEGSAQLGAGLSPDDSASSTPIDQGDESSSDRRLRRHRHDRRDSEPVQAPVSRTGRSNHQPVVNSVFDLAAQNVSSIDASTQAVAAPREGANATAAAATQAASLVRSAAAANTASTPSSGTRNSIEAMEPANRLRDGLAPAKPAKSNNNSTAAETVSRVKLIQRVSKAFQHLGPEGGVVRIRLAPAEMGSVRVEMRVHQRKVDARVIAESEAAGAALREHLPDLRQRLESQGMQIERLEIEMEQRQSSLGQSPDQQGRDDRWQQASEQQNRWRPALSSQSQQSDAPNVSRHATANDSPHAGAASAGVDIRL